MSWKEKAPLSSPKAPQTIQHIFRLLMPLTPPQTCSEGLPWQRGGSGSPQRCSIHPHGGLGGLLGARSQWICPTPFPHARVCSQPPALPRSWFIPAPSELNSPMLFPRREQQLKAPVEDRGEEGEEDKSNRLGRVPTGENKGEELLPRGLDGRNGLWAVIRQATLGLGPSHCKSLARYLSCGRGQGSSLRGCQALPSHQH